MSPGARSPTRATAYHLRSSPSAPLMPRRASLARTGEAIDRRRWQQHTQMVLEVALREPISIEHLGVTEPDVARDDHRDEAVADQSIRERDAIRLVVQPLREPRILAHP